MQKLLAIVALVLPLGAAVATGVAIANTGYPLQIVEAEAQNPFQNFGSLEKRAPSLFSMPPVIAAHHYNAKIGIEPVLIARLDK